MTRPHDLKPSWQGPFAVTDPAGLQKIFEFREQILRGEPGLLDTTKLHAGSFRDSHDDHGYHCIVTAGDAIVGSGRMCVHHDPRELPYSEGYQHLIAHLPGPFASLNRLAIYPAMRRQGLTRPLTDARIAAAQAQGARSMFVEAAPNRMPTLLDMGFVTLGETGGEPYIVPFAIMYLDISR